MIDLIAEGYASREACFQTEEEARVFAAANGGEVYRAEWPEEPK